MQSGLIFDQLFNHILFSFCCRWLVGVAADISHCCTKAKVTAGTGMEEIGQSLTGCHVVIVPAGVPRKPGMTRDDLFNTNASIVKVLTFANSLFPLVQHFSIQDQFSYILLISSSQTLTLTYLRASLKLVPNTALKLCSSSSPIPSIPPFLSLQR